jgi:hypothetical protein
MHVVHCLRGRLTRVGRFHVVPYDETETGMLSTNRCFFGKVDKAGKELFVKLANPREGRNLARLEREIDVLKQLRDANIIALYDSGRHQFQVLDGTVIDCPFAVFPFISGDLHEKTAGMRWSPPWQMVAITLRGIAAAIRTLRRHGIVHGDIKPDNILWDGRRPKLIDFGEARFVNRNERERPTRGIVNEYSPPDKLIAAAWDVYSLGVLAHNFLYEESFIESRLSKGKCHFRATIPVEQRRLLQTLATRAVETGLENRESMAEQILDGFCSLSPRANMTDAGWYANAIAKGRLLPADSEAAPLWMALPRSRMHLPRQGWKIHIGMNQQNSKRVLPAVLEIVRRGQAAAKVVANWSELKPVARGGWNQLYRGKSVTIYPLRQEQFIKVMSFLQTRLGDVRGRGAANDFPVNGTPILGYRYGVFVWDGDQNGLESPDGTRIPDNRGRWVPPWASVPKIPGSRSCQSRD